jgi:hypothetical protein
MRPVARRWLFIATPLFLSCQLLNKEAQFVGRWEASGEALNLKTGGEGVWQWHNRESQRVVWEYWRGDSAVVVVKSKFSLVERMKAAKKGIELPGDYKVIASLRDADTLVIQDGGAFRDLRRAR